VDRPALEGYLFPDRGGEGDGQRRESGQGSGVILSEDGLIMTNANKCSSCTGPEANARPLHIWIRPTW